MKKIFIVAQHPSIKIGGAEVKSLNIAIELKARGYDVSFLSPGKIDTKLKTDSNGINILKYKLYRFKLLSLFSCFRILRQNKKDIYYIRCSSVVEGMVVLGT